MTMYAIKGKEGTWVLLVALVVIGETKCSDVSCRMRSGGIHQVSRASSHLPSISGLVCGVLSLEPLKSFPLTPRL